MSLWGAWRRSIWMMTDWQRKEGNLNKVNGFAQLIQCQSELHLMWLYCSKYLSSMIISNHISNQRNYDFATKDLISFYIINSVCWVGTESLRRQRKLLSALRQNMEKCSTSSVQQFCNRYLFTEKAKFELLCCCHFSLVQCFCN